MHNFTKNISIALVDDDADDRQLFDEALADIIEHYELKSFKDGRLFLEFLNDKQNRNPLPDLVFLDINMPILDGLETLEIIRTQMRIVDVPVVIYSTSCIARDVEKALSAGANLYLTKPTCFKKLKETLLKIIQTNFQEEVIDPKTFLVSV